MASTAMIGTAVAPAAAPAAEAQADKVLAFRSLALAGARGTHVTGPDPRTANPCGRNPQDTESRVNNNGTSLSPGEHSPEINHAWDQILNVQKFGERSEFEAAHSAIKHKLKFLSLHIVARRMNASTFGLVY